MRINSFSWDESGCGWIRIKTPFSQLAKKHYVKIADGKTPYTMDGWDIVVFSNLMGDVMLIRNGKERMVSLQTMIADFKKHGARIIYDTDDLQDKLHKGVEKHKRYEEVKDSFKVLLKNTDLITVTTEKLKRELEKRTDKPIVVLPNCINPKLFPQRKGGTEKVKIAYAGGSAHILDGEIVMPALYNLRRKGLMNFETFGFALKYKDWKTRDKKFVPVKEYYQGLADMNADIGICPLRDTLFNSCKSPLKFLEYAMVGTMTLASNRLPYKGELKKEWLVDDDKWEETLERFILDKDLREATSKEQQEWVLKHRDIRKEYIRWEDAYYQLIKNQIEITNSPNLKIEPMPDNAGEVLKAITGKLKMPYWVSAGTALGLYRDKDFIKGDTDVDIAMEGYDGVDEEIVELVRGEIMRTVYDAKKRPMQLAILKDGVLLDFYFHYQNGANLENIAQSGWTRMPKEICLKPQIIKTKYGEFPFPQEKYFEIRYGEWKVPSDTKPKFYET